MVTYNLFDVGSEVIATKYNVPATAVKKRLLMLDLDPKRAYRKLSNILAIFDNGGLK